MLGKNGDQLERLARTAADILVLQHCHEVTPAVISTLRAHASDYRNPRRYLVIDGYDTLRIIRATRASTGLNAVWSALVYRSSSMVSTEQRTSRSRVWIR
jgi:hypothetical protein